MEESNLNKPIDLQAIPEGAEPDTYANFKEKLEQVQQFPGKYNFKFIINGEAEIFMQLQAIFPTDELKKNPSKTGKYISVTIVKEVENADEVVALYKQAGTIKGIMLL